MSGSRDARDRHTFPTIERRRLTLIESGFQPVPDRRAPRGQPPATETGFGSRLRLERERRRITLASIAADTKISHTLLEGLERDDLSRWPSGIFRRAFIRAYAQAIGLDSDLIAREFLEHFRDPAEPPRPASPDAAPAPAPEPAPEAGGDTTLRLTLADPVMTFRPGHSLEGAGQRLVAVVCDLFVLVAIGLGFFVAFNQFWMLFAIATLAYYTGSIVLLGNTPGVFLCAHRSVGSADARPMASLACPLKAAASAIRTGLMFDRSRGGRPTGVAAKPDPGDKSSQPV
jgi:transcriptional regulator with XRE-family HTH domain